MMNRIAGFPASTCSIRLPDGSTPAEEVPNSSNDPESNYKKRQWLITFGHSQWGFKNWSWSVTKQDLDFIDYANGKFSAGVVAFVSVTVKHLGISREDVGYATSVASQKGSAIHNARKSSVTNALRETLLSFGGTIATQLLEQLENNRLESQTNTERSVAPIKYTDMPINGGEIRNASANSKSNMQNCPPRKDSRDSSSSSGDCKKIDVPKSPQRPAAVATVSIVHIDKPQMSCNPRVKTMELPSHPANQTVGTGQGFAANQNVMKMAPPLLQQAPPNVLQAESSLSGLSEEEQRAERKRRQKQKQEEFKRKILHTNNI